MKSGMMLGLTIALTPLSVPSASAAASGNFASYKLEVSPIEGPLNPEVEKRYSPHLGACQNIAKTTEDSVFCFEAEFIRQDASLNRAWKAVLDRLPASQHSALTAAQRSWIARRDPFCKQHATNFGGGTIQPVDFVACRTELTIRRTTWLENLR